MRALKIASFAICLAMLAPLTAQEPGYRAKTYIKQNGHLFIEIDSRQQIEAFAYSAHCGEWSTTFIDDMLDIPSGSIYRGFPPPSVEQGREREWAPVTGADFAPDGNGGFAQQSRCTWKANVDAVIYPDGSYEGDEAEVRFIQAYRDGIAARVNYWMARFTAQTDTAANLESIQEEAYLHREEPGCGQTTPECGYAHGKRNVDGNIGGWVYIWKNPKLWYQMALQQMTMWQKLLDDNLALKRLEVTFPLPDALVERKTEAAANP